jgi:hypothetical protein
MKDVSLWWFALFAVCGLLLNVPDSRVAPARSDVRPLRRDLLMFFISLTT